MDERLKKLCRNYNAIVSCEFLDDDLFSQRLVEYYKKAVRETVVKDVASAKRLFKFDKVMNKYIEDYNFSRKLQNSLDVGSIINCKTDISQAVLEYVTEFSDEYDEDKEEIIVNTRWI